MENASNFTPLDDEILAKDLYGTDAPAQGFFENRKMLFFTIGAFAVVSVLVIVITLLIRIRENSIQARGASMDNITKVGAEAQDSDSLDTLGDSKPSPTKKISVTRPPTRTPTITKSPTPTSRVTATTAPTSTTVPTSTLAPTLLPTATNTPVPPTSTPTPTTAPTATNTSTPTPTPQAPGAPTSLDAQRGAGIDEADLTWVAPASDGGSPITDYVVQYKLSTDGSWSTFSHSASTNTAITVTVPQDGFNYDFRVAAVNAVGQSGFVEVLSTYIGGV